MNRDSLLAMFFLAGLLVAIPIFAADYYFDFSGWKEAAAEREAKRAAWEKRLGEHAERRREFDQQIANETPEQAAKRRLHFWGHVEDQVERLTK